MRVPQLAGNCELAFSSDVSRSSEARSVRAWSVAGGLFCVVMCVLHVAAGLNTGGLPDFWRDMYWATSIAYGERFPLSGPPIDQFMELGPWWFYLLAAPVWLTHRIAFASAFLQLLASAKYFLAWRLGTRAVDARFGTIYAVCTAVAGWSTASFWFPSHPAVVETTLLLLAWATWRCWTRLSLGNAVVYGLAAAACFHAHPTTATYIVASGIALLCRHCSWRADAGCPTSDWGISAPSAAGRSATAGIAAGARSPCSACPRRSCC